MNNHSWFCPWYLWSVFDRIKNHMHWKHYKSVLHRDSCMLLSYCILRMYLICNLITRYLLPRPHAEYLDTALGFNYCFFLLPRLTNYASWSFDGVFRYFARWLCSTEGSTFSVRFVLYASVLMRTRANQVNNYIDVFFIIKYIIKVYEIDSKCLSNIRNATHR